MSQREAQVKVKDEPPTFIIGLPKDSFEADLAKTKFADTISFLKKMAPEIEEARCKMKLHNIAGNRKRYEVDVNIITPYATHSYGDSGWDLAKLFDEMSASLRKQFVQEKQLRKQRGSVRRAVKDVSN